VNANFFVESTNKDAGNRHFGWQVFLRLKKVSLSTNLSRANAKA
jgi:hypothetical protein